ncbi:DUF2157 domain-containing protein [Actinokineospora sp. UTMC 2448]|uniref:DUF2157 domain-containing protein n=1 Tax=Actinokineospora sp. UTMC 2448 TaxID=2268449 RepID=UPI0021645A70|nr:DUF2157 domain-containing protein [Actinokineospora sp. UTMC 2448]UVS79438.1 hypothetical protein Actkin_03186 [Actinokineospora sp. UTMC 2448]
MRDALAEERVPATARRSEILAYLGGGLVLVGAALTVATSWADLSRPARSLVVLGATAGLLLAGLLVSQHGSRAGHRAATALFALGAGVGALAAGTVATAHAGMWAASTALALSALTYAYLPSLPSLGVAGISAFALVVDLVLAEGRGEGRAAAAALVALGVLWGALTVSELVRPVWAGYGIAVATALIGAQLAIDGLGRVTWAYILTAGIAVFCSLAYARYRHPILLAGAVIGTTVAVPQALWDWTGGTVGAAASVLVAGAVLLLFGTLGVWRRSRGSYPRRRHSSRVGGRRQAEGDRGVRGRILGQRPERDAEASASP